MTNPFEKIKLIQLYNLYKIIVDSEIRDIGNIKRKYLENGLSFNETLSFLEDLKMIKINSNEIIQTKTFSIINNTLEEFKNKIIHILFSRNGNIAEQLKSFLTNFQNEGNNICFYATEMEKVKYSDTRNLLLELEFILQSTSNTSYFVNPEFTELFFKQFNVRKLSPVAMLKKQTENESIGLMAEKAVIQYEAKRLTNISLLFNEIEHTSQLNVLAGYDIKSFENYRDSEFKRIDRFIEVKSVSLDDFKFYWSKNEIEIAKIFGEKYYLYLLPVISNNLFDFNKLIIIRNPFKSIYLNEVEWGKEVESISIKKNQTGN